MSRLYLHWACVHGSTNGTNGIPMSFTVLPMVPLVIPLVPMVMPMVPLALLMVPLVSQWYHWLPMVPLVKPIVPLGEPRTDPGYFHKNVNRHIRVPSFKVFKDITNSIVVF